MVSKTSTPHGSTGSCEPTQGESSKSPPQNLLFLRVRRLWLGGFLGFGGLGLRFKRPAALYHRSIVEKKHGEKMEKKTC